MTPDRETLFEALFALSEAVRWGGTGFQYRSRRVRHWDDLSVQPALCQAEQDEEARSKPGLPYRWILSASWVVYHRAGADPAATPAGVNNAILDAIEAVLAPPPFAVDERQMLGGLVHHCFIDGKVFKDPGDLDGQALMIVPIKLLVP